MSNAILVNKELVQVQFTKNNTWQTVDLAQYLKHPDPKIVVIHSITVFAVTATHGVRPVGSSLPNARTQRALLTNNSRQIPVSLNGGTTVQLFASNIWAAFYIHAEFGGDDVEAYADASDLGTASPNAWRTIDRTTQYGSDAGNVSATILWLDFINNGDWGYREFGSTDNFHPNNAAGSSTFGICAVDSQDRYETYQSRSGGKSPNYQAFIYEVGYVKSGWNHITNPVDRNLNTTGTYTISRS
jgi:hypothetical protein